MVSEYYNIAFLQKKLDEIYEQENILLEKMKLLYTEYEQLQEDKQLLELMLMHQFNKKDRVQNVFR